MSNCARTRGATATSGWLAVGFANSSNDFIVLMSGEREIARKLIKSINDTYYYEVSAPEGLSFDSVRLEIGPYDDTKYDNVEFDSVTFTA